MKSSSPGVIGGRNRTSRVDVGGNTEYLKGINASSRRLSSRGLTRRVSPHVIKHHLGQKVLEYYACGPPSTKGGALLRPAQALSC